MVPADPPAHPVTDVDLDRWHALYTRVQKALFRHRPAREWMRDAGELAGAVGMLVTEVRRLRHAVRALSRLDLTDTQRQAVAQTALGTPCFPASRPTPGAEDEGP